MQATSGQEAPGQPAAGKPCTGHTEQWLQDKRAIERAIEQLAAF